MSPLTRALLRLRDLRARRTGQRKRSGSIAVLTLLAIGVVFGAFLYVAVLGSRVIEKTRVQTAADATAMASATIKARTLNYAAFLFLAESVVLPLGQVAWFITPAQLAANMPGVCGALIGIGLEEDGVDCLYHLLGTVVTSQLKARDIGSWLDTMEQTAAALDEIGPLWAELVAMQTGTAASYKAAGGKSGATGSVDTAVSYPLPVDATCGGLGIQLVDNGEPIEPEGQSACRIESQWEQVYALMALEALWSPLDLWGWLQMDPGSACGWFTSGGAPALGAMCSAITTVPNIITIPVAMMYAGDFVTPLGMIARGVLSGHAFYAADAAVQGRSVSDYLFSGEVACHFTHKVPALGSAWKQHQRSIGLAMIGKPSEPLLLSRLSSLKRGERSAPQSSGPPGLLGIACAEHYSQGNVGKESLWHMDWRARLVPCQLRSGADRALVEQCSDPADVLAARFTWQMDLGMGTDFSH